MFNISVSDKGIGILSDEIERIFTPYFKTREVNSLKVNPMGHGLGLYISQSIAKLMGGKLKVYSKLGQGTTICLKIKLKKI